MHWLRRHVAEHCQASKRSISSPQLRKGWRYSDEAPAPCTSFAPIGALQSHAVQCGVIQASMTSSRGPALLVR